MRRAIGITSLASAASYSRFPDKNCYDGHGGANIDYDSDAPERLSVEACEARCDSDVGCLCVTHSPSSGKCWKRRACEPDRCVHDSAFDTYVKKGDYSEHDGKNCYEGHGGHILEPSDAAPAGLTVDACQARCDANTDCECVTFQPSNGKCWMRAACNASEFATNDRYVTYVSSREPAPTRDKAVYAKVSTSRGPLQAVAETCIGSAEAPDRDGAYSYCAEIEVDWVNAQRYENVPSSDALPKGSCTDFGYTAPCWEITNTLSDSMGDFPAISRYLSRPVATEATAMV